MTPLPLRSVMTPREFTSFTTVRNELSLSISSHRVLFCQGLRREESELLLSEVLT